MFKVAVFCVLALLITSRLVGQSKDCNDVDFVKAADSLSSQLVKLQIHHDRLLFYTEKLSQTKPININIQSIFPGYITAFEEFIACHATVISGNADRCIRMYRCYDVGSTNNAEYVLGISPYGNVFFFNGFPNNDTVSALEFICGTIRKEDDVMDMIRIYNEIFGQSFDSIDIIALAGDSFRVQALNSESQECINIEIVDGRTALIEHCTRER